METIEFETAKKFAKLGLRLESSLLWRYKYTKGAGKLILELRRFADTEMIVGDSDILYYRAYTLDEILAMLPSSITYKTSQKDYRLMLSRKWPPLNHENGGYIIEYNYPSRFTHKNPAEAAAQLLMWCIENGYVKVEDINNG